MKTKCFLFALVLMLGFTRCGDKPTPSPTPTPTPTALAFVSARIGVTAVSNGVTTYGINPTEALRISFNNKIDRNTVAANISLTENSATTVPVNFSYENNDSIIVITGASALKYLTKYGLYVNTGLKSAAGGGLNSSVTIGFLTMVDPADKFPLISDNALLDTIQRAHFRYFWDYGHPVSGLARERSNATPETVTSGGSGFGIMAIVAGINRNFVTRAQGLARMQTIVGFLKNSAVKHHGAFPHWMNGSTGATIAFSTKDDGADLVETSYLVAGLLTARQYFNGADAAETTLRADINTICNNVEWDWFRRGGQNVLYWHWSPNYAWDMNMPIRGWNECLITYILAASSTTHGVPASVYTGGWAANGTNGFINGSSYYGYVLPLGPSRGGPLFWAHYSFLGVNPNGLSDTYANYQTQVVNHTKINYEYCKANPLGYYGYSNECWGLTASDIPNGYNANEPNNDKGVISPTAALSSMPYTPTESMAALKYFYYKLGDKAFMQYGFVDAFSLKDVWFANSHLAIDQGPIMVMIENYRSQLIWNLFTSCPEVKNGMKNVLGFSAAYL